MATGFRLTAETGAGNLKHTMSDHLHWNPDTSRWLAVAQDTTTDDWALWDNDGADPAAGAEGGWSHEVDDLGPANVYVDTRDGASLVNYFDPDTGILHTLSFDHATERYQQWRYNSGSNDWTHLVTNEDPGINTDTPDGNCCLFTDSNGVPWIVYHDIADLKLKAIYRSGGSWTVTPVVIEATASTSAIGALRVDGMRWKDDDAAAAVMVCYSYGVAGGDKWRAAYRKDSAALTAAWSTEDIETSASIDNHLSAQAVELGADTKSTICIVTKRGSGNVLDFHKRSIGAPGSWAKTAAIRSDSTRPKLCIDKENDEVYVFCGLTVAGSNTQVIYRKSAISTISFGGDVKILEDDGVTTFNANVSVPDKPVDATADLYVLGQNSGNFWWNRVPISAAAGSPPSQLALLGVG